MKSKNFQPASNTNQLLPCLEINKDLKSATLAFSAAVKPFKENIEFAYLTVTLCNLMTFAMPGPGMHKFISD